LFKQNDSQTWHEGSVLRRKLLKKPRRSKENVAGSVLRHRQQSSKSQKGTEERSRGCEGRDCRRWDGEILLFPSTRTEFGEVGCEN
jgi:hypothetical protein